VFLDGETRLCAGNKYILEHVANNRARLNFMACITEFAVRKLQNNRRRGVKGNRRKKMKVN
jgi:hypothetical protein